MSGSATRKLGYWGLGFQAVVFAILISLPGILEYLHSDGLSPLIFDDWDEPYYLPLLSEGSGESILNFCRRAKNAPRRQSNNI